MSKIITLEQLKASSGAAKKFTGELVGKLTQTVTETMTKMESAKANKLSVVDITIPTTGWKNDDNASYPKYYDIIVKEIMDNDRAIIIIAPVSLRVAKACGLCPTNETLAGKIRVRSISVPPEDIHAECWIADGKE